MEKVSIIIPVYETEKYLSECLNSVINQTYNNIEIICVYKDGVLIDAWGNKCDKGAIKVPAKV